jgi:hypothetical protein
LALNFFPGKFMPMITNASTHVAESFKEKEKKENNKDEVFFRACRDPVLCGFLVGR